jgi:hypothetical protein
MPLRATDDFDALQKFLARFAHDPALEDRVGNYYELLCPRLTDIIGDFPEAREVVLGERPVPSATFPEAIRISTALLARYPIVRFRSHVFSDDVFLKVERFFNWTYFAKLEIDLDATEGHQAGHWERGHGQS